MFYKYLIDLLELNDVDNDVAEVALHNYIYKDLDLQQQPQKLLMASTTLLKSNKFDLKINKKARKIIFYSLRTTKFLLKYAVKTILNYVLPPVAKELSKLGINELIKIIEKYLKKELFNEENKEKEDFFKNLSSEAKNIFDKIIANCKKIFKKQNRQLKQDLNNMVIKQNDKKTTDKEVKEIKELKEEIDEVKEVLDKK